MSIDLNQRNADYIYSRAQLSMAQNSQCFNLNKRIKTNMESFVKAPVIENEGLILPVMDGYTDDRIICIWHQGSRYLNPLTIEHWRKLDGIIAIEEGEYHVTIKRSPNFEWEQIFHPEHYVVGWEWKKD